MVYYIRKKAEGEIRNTGRVERVLRLIKYLQEFRSIKETAVYLNVSEKSIQRYLNMLINFGFIIETRTLPKHANRIINLNEFFEMDKIEDKVLITTRVYNYSHLMPGFNNQEQNLTKPNI